ncbi:hypothetical protein [Nocardia sp. NPDC005998]
MSQIVGESGEFGYRQQMPAAEPLLDERSRQMAAATPARDTTSVSVAIAG